MGKLVLIDGNAILHRAYHALPPLTSKKGDPINAVYGLISMLLRVISDLKPTHIAVAFDRKEPTFRHLAFQAYQAQRPVMDSDLSSQFEKAKKVIKAFGIPIYEKAGYEADDVIATLATTSDQEVVVVTGDRDILQLVDDKVKVYMPVGGLSNAKLMGKQEVLEKLGVNPKQIPDYKALVGDASDNYPGVSGIGPKTAIALLKQFKTIDQIYKNLEKVDKKIAEKLKRQKDDVFLYRKLAKLVQDVDVSPNFDDMAKWRLDSKKVLELFKTFGFKTLTKRVKEVGKKIADESQSRLF